MAFATAVFFFMHSTYLFVLHFFIVAVDTSSAASGKGVGVQAWVGACLILGKSLLRMLPLQRWVREAAEMVRLGGMSRTEARRTAMVWQVLWLESLPETYGCFACVLAEDFSVVLVILFVDFMQDSLPMGMKVRRCCCCCWWWWWFCCC